MSARSDLIDLIAGMVPATWDLYDYPTNLDGIETGTTIVMVDTYSEQAQPIRGLRSHTIGLALVVPTTDPQGAADDLDVAWDVLRVALDALSGASLIHWTEATRGTFMDTYPSLTIPVSMNTKD